jgi:hypothetical protein
MTSGHARRAPRQSIATWVCTLAVGVGLVACHRIHCKLENKTMATNDATTIPSIPDASATEPFILEYSIEAEGAVGTDLSRIKTTLLVRGDSRQAILEKHRSQSDQAGEAIGTFQAEVSEQALANLRAKAHATIVPALPPRDGMGPGSSIITLKLQEGATKTTRTFSTGDMAILSVVEGLLEELDGLSGQLARHPRQAVQATVAYQRHPSRFVLTLTNIGREPICFADPRFLPEDADRWAGAQVAEFPEPKPGFTAPPLQWQRVPLAKPASPPPALEVALKPGATFTAETVPWTPGMPKRRFLAQGVWSDYTGSGTCQDMYRVRGATFSEALKLMPADLD